MSMTLYAAPMSSATPVVQAVTELAVPCEIAMLDLAAGKQKQPSFLALNPNGKVPTLVVDGTPFFEAVAILQWLGDQFGVERKLWPTAGSPERLEALSWTTWAYVTYAAEVRRLNLASGACVPEELHNVGQAAAARAELHHLLDLLEARLEPRAFLLGDSFSLADLIVAGVVTWSGYCGVSLDDHPRTRAWLDRSQSRPSFGSAWRPAA